MKTLPEKTIFEEDLISDLGEDLLTDEELFAFGMVLVDAMSLCPPEGVASAAPVSSDGSDYSGLQLN